LGQLNLNSSLTDGGEAVTRATGPAYTKQPLTNLVWQLGLTKT